VAANVAEVGNFAVQETYLCFVMPSFFISAFSAYFAVAFSQDFDDVTTFHLV
jgi:hypothetical protein